MQRANHRVVGVIELESVHGIVSPNPIGDLPGDWSRKPADSSADAQDQSQVMLADPERLQSDLDQELNQFLATA